MCIRDRTLLQQARPITFGLKTAGWLEGIVRSQNRLSETQSRLLKLQLSGAVGSGNASINQKVHQTMAQELGLTPSFSWQTQRDGFAEWASVLGILVGSLGKIAKDVSLLMPVSYTHLDVYKRQTFGCKHHCRRYRYAR